MERGSDHRDCLCCMHCKSAQSMPGSFSSRYVIATLALDVWSSHEQLSKPRSITINSSTVHHIAIFEPYTDPKDANCPRQSKSHSDEGVRWLKANVWRRGFVRLASVEDE